MVNYNDVLQFYKGKRIFVTGHTGFKGTWLCRLLLSAGANVTGYALSPKTNPSLFFLSGAENDMQSVLKDVRDLSSLKSTFNASRPEIVIHMAAQPIVRDSYKDPVYTYETNVMGTVHIMECIRGCESVKSFLNVTTDKVYQNNEWEWGYREEDSLGGFDPYSNSKSCSELVTQCYNRSFFSERQTAISTARAGNVIGGGDFANDRIVPDCIRAVQNGEIIQVRNPHSVRPYQHVLEPLFAYLMIVKRQYEDKSFEGAYNIGPDDRDCITTGELATIFCKIWRNGASWENSFSGGPHEANFLRLDCSRIKKVFSWQPRWTVEQAIEKTCEWSNVWLSGKPVAPEMDREISQYINGD